MLLYVLVVVANEDMLFVLNPLALAIGSVLPDCDHRRAPAGRILPLWLFGAKHRGITHTVYAAVIFGGIGWYFVSWEFGMSLTIGYMIHLMMDAGTPMGIRFWSISNKKPT